MKNKEKRYYKVNLVQSLEVGDLVIDGYDTNKEDLSSASIVDLRLDLEQQKRLLHYDVHPDREIMPYGMNGEIIVLQEGEFLWDSAKMDYIKIS